MSKKRLNQWLTLRELNKHFGAPEGVILDAIKNGEIESRLIPCGKFDRELWHIALWSFRPWWQRVEAERHKRARQLREKMRHQPHQIRRSRGREAQQ